MVTTKVIVNWLLIVLVFVSVLPSIISNLTVANLSTGAQALLNLLPLFMVIGIVLLVSKSKGGK